MIFVGIDPGVSGGIALLSEDGQVMETWKMPETDRDLLDVFETVGAHVVSRRSQTMAVLERVNAGVFGAAKGQQRMGVTSAFTFGKGIGRLKMALTAARIPFDEVAPVTWQSALACRSKGDKNVTKARAQQLFPDTKITHAIADALLMAEYCRRLHGGKLRPLPPSVPLQSSIEGRRDSESYGKEEGREGGKEEGRQGRQGRQVRQGTRRRRARVEGF